VYELMASLLVAEALVLSAGYKVLRPGEYASAFASYTALQRWPREVRRIAGAGLPAVEVAVAALVLAPPTRLVGALAAVVLMSCLSLVIALDKRTAVAQCGCWGSARLDVPKSAYLLRNGVLLAGAGVALLAASTPVGAAELAIGALMVAPFALLTLELPHFVHMASIRSIPR
jgi:Methylamine utilisation protein MauE